jgi:hypothetical protein
MNKNWLFTLTLLASPVFAGGQGPGDVRELDWNQFLESCQNPAAFQAQRPPENIKITCGDMSYQWIPAGAGSMDLPGSRVVRTEVFSDKYHVQAQDNTMQVAPSVGSCPRFKEVQQTLTTERSVTCKEILKFQGDLKDYCASVIDSARGDNANLVQTQDTGRTLDFCK